jgi:hypothetical protein
MKSKKNLKWFEVKTFDGTGYFSFFTRAENQKKALARLQRRSSDFKSIVSDDKNLSIKVTEVL